MSEAVDKAYRALREQIFSGELRTGDRLKERDICNELDLSRTPVREALRKLQADGLVEIEPRRGGVVAGIGADEINEIYSLGILLESFAARLAAERHDDKDLTELEQLLEEMSRALDEDTPAGRTQYLELDSKLHRKILAMTSNRRLSSVVRQIVGVPVLIQAFTHYSHQDLLASLQQHRTIVAAVRAGDPDWAEAAMRSHIHAGRSILQATTTTADEV